MEEAVRSALNQTYRPVEVIVVDDGSTDATFTILDSIDDDRLRVLRSDGRGVAAARNHALSHAHYPYVAFLDADDVWDPQKLERQIALLRSNGELIVVGCLLHHIAPDGRVLGVAGVNVVPGDQERIAAGRYMPFSCSAILTLRNAVEEVGGFDSEVSPAEDMDLLAKLARHGKVGCVDQVLGSYRIHRGSASGRSYIRQQECMRFIAARIEAEADGVRLTLGRYLAENRRSLNQRRVDRARAMYRFTGEHLAERNYLRALAFGAGTFLLAPRFTVRRALLQRRKPVGR